ncbi:hypothetical protein KAU08_06960 [bacterium]|nr:hypothetical protein [bacterium]
MDKQVTFKGNGDIFFKNEQDDQIHCPVTFQISVFEDSGIRVKCGLDNTERSNIEFSNTYANLFSTGETYLQGVIDSSSQIRTGPISVTDLNLKLVPTHETTLEGNAYKLDINCAEKGDDEPKPEKADTDDIKYCYYLSNFLVIGNASDTYTNSAGETKRGRIVLNCSIDSIDCMITILPEFADLIGHKPKIGVQARTAKLCFSISRSMSTDDADQLANDICSMLSLATWNTVFWTAREILDSAELSIHTHFRVPKLLPYQKQQLIPDDQLPSFLNMCYSAYKKEKDGLYLERVIGFLIESIHHQIMDVKFALAFLALIRLVTAKLKGHKRYLIHLDWVEFMESWKAIIPLFFLKVFLRLDSEKLEIIRKKMRNLNNMPTYNDICIFCEQLEIPEPPKTIIHWRNDLFHIGRPPSKWDINDIIRNHCYIFRCIEEAILKILMYRADYHKFWEGHIE